MCRYALQLYFFISTEIIEFHYHKQPFTNKLDGYICFSDQFLDLKVISAKQIILNLYTATTTPLERGFPRQICLLDDTWHTKPRNSHKSHRKTTNLQNCLSDTNNLPNQQRQNIKNKLNMKITRWRVHNGDAGAELARVVGSIVTCKNVWRCGTPAIAGTNTKE